MLRARRRRLNPCQRNDSLSSLRSARLWLPWKVLFQQYEAVADANGHENLRGRNGSGPSAPVASLPLNVTVSKSPNQLCHSNLAYHARAYARSLYRPSRRDLRWRATNTVGRPWGAMAGEFHRKTCCGQMLDDEEPPSKPGTCQTEACPRGRIAGRRVEGVARPVDWRARDRIGSSPGRPAGQVERSTSFRPNAHQPLQLTLAHRAIGSSPVGLYGGTGCGESSGVGPASG